MRSAFGALIKSSVLEVSSLPSHGSSMVLLWGDNAGKLKPITVSVFSGNNEIANWFLVPQIISKLIVLLGKRIGLIFFFLRYTKSSETDWLVQWWSLKVFSVVYSPSVFWQRRNMDAGMKATTWTLELYREITLTICALSTCSEQTAYLELEKFNSIYILCQIQSITLNDIVYWVIKSPGNLAVYMTWCLPVSL